VNPEELMQKIKEIISIVEEIPETYRQKTYEILLENSLEKDLLSEVPNLPTEVKEIDVSQKSKFVIPIDVRALFQQQNIPEEVISKLFYTEGNAIRPAYTIKTTKKAVAQVQLTLLVSLENALLGGKFEFSMETVRQRCNEHRVYDKVNFKTYFKYKSKLFKSLADEEHVELSPDGKAELAEVILEITK